MKKIILSLIAVMLVMTIANAQDAAQNGTVTLKNGVVVEGSIQKQGTDVVLTTASGDVFYFAQSEIAKISLVEEKKIKPHEVSKSITGTDLALYKQNVKMAYRDSRVSGKNMDEFWGGNTYAEFCYKKYKKLNNAALATGIVGTFAVGTGTLLFSGAFDRSEDRSYYSEYYEEWYVERVYYFDGFGPGWVVFGIGGAMLVTSWILPGIARKNLKLSYQYYTKEGQNHTVNVSAAPVFYAQGGAGIGVAINF